MWSRLLQGVTSTVCLPCTRISSDMESEPIFVWFQETAAWSGILSRAYMAWGANSSPQSCHYNPSNLTAWEHEQIWKCIKTQVNSWQTDFMQEHSCKRTHERIWSRKRLKHNQELHFNLLMSKLDLTEFTVTTKLNMRDSDSGHY